MVIIQVGRRKPWRLQTCRRTVGHACTETNCQSVSPVWSHLYSFLYCSVYNSLPSLLAILSQVYNSPSCAYWWLTYTQHYNTLAVNADSASLLFERHHSVHSIKGAHMDCNVICYPRLMASHQQDDLFIRKGEILVHSSRLLSEGLFLPFEYKNKRRIRWLPYIGLNPTHYFETNFS